MAEKAQILYIYFILVILIKVSNFLAELNLYKFE